VLPLALCFGGYAASTIQRSFQSLSAAKRDTNGGNQTPTHTRRLQWAWRTYVMIVVISNVFAIGYFSQIHQRGPISLVDHLAELGSQRAELMRTQASVTALDVDILMPCHSTPMHSYLHGSNQGLRIRTLDCSPRFHQELDAQGVARYWAFNNDTAHAEFLRDPSAFVMHRYEAGLNSTGYLPQLIAMFDHHELLCQPVLRRLRYAEVSMLRCVATAIQVGFSDHCDLQVTRFFHSHFDDAKYVLLLERAGHVAS